MLFNNSEMSADENKEESAQNIFPQLILSFLRIIPSHFVLPLLVLTTMNRRSLNFAYRSPLFLSVFVYSTSITRGN